MDIKRKLNWRPDLPDHRDFKFKDIKMKVSAPTVLPPVVDLRPHCSPVFDQGQIGSCTGNSIAAALEFLELKEEREKEYGDASKQIYDANKYDPISRLFIYYNERAIEGDVSKDGGAQIRTGVKVINSLGACRESVWAYNPENLFKKPSAAAYAEAIIHKAVSYSRIDNFEDMRKCLAHGYPFTLGIVLYDSFMSEEVAKTGIVPMPTIFERQQGGHAVLCVGYDDNKKVFIIRNSWGPNWGDKGYFYLPYEYATNPGLADDFWTIREKVESI